jgi:8-oxo-dGTP pyrophosphatase MutT (NUDIX family)
MVKAVGCFIEYEGKILLLHRNSDRPEGNKLGAVVGKIEQGESYIDAIIREIFEETGNKINSNELEYLGEIFNIPLFKLKLKEKFQVKIRCDEHHDFKWATPQDIYSMENVVSGMHDFLKEVGYIK